METQDDTSSNKVLGRVPKLKKKDEKRKGTLVAEKLSLNNFIHFSSGK